MSMPRLVRKAQQNQISGLLFAFLCPPKNYTCAHECVCIQQKRARGMRQHIMEWDKRAKERKRVVLIIAEDGKSQKKSEAANEQSNLVAREEREHHGMEHTNWNKSARRVVAEKKVAQEKKYFICMDRSHTMHYWHFSTSDFPICVIQFRIKYTCRRWMMEPKAGNECKRTHKQQYVMMPRTQCLSLRHIHYWWRWWCCCCCCHIVLYASRWVHACIYEFTAEKYRTLSAHNDNNNNINNERRKRCGWKKKNYDEKRQQHFCRTQETKRSIIIW